MRKLIARPLSPWEGFLRGAGFTFMGVGVNFIIFGLFRFWNDDLLGALPIFGGFALGFTLLGGLALALWRIIQNWIYDRYIGGPE